MNTTPPDQAAKFHDYLMHEVSEYQRIHNCPRRQARRAIERRLVKQAKKQAKASA